MRYRAPLRWHTSRRPQATNHASDKASMHEYLGRTAMPLPSVGSWMRPIGGASGRLPSNGLPSCEAPPTAVSDYTSHTERQHDASDPRSTHA